MRSAAIKVRTAPKKSLGTYETIEKGARKRRSCEVMMKAPHTRERVPVRKVKSVCEKIYEPVNPPVAHAMQALSECGRHSIHARK